MPVKHAIITVMSVTMLVSVFVLTLSLFALVLISKLYLQVKRYTFVAKSFVGALPAVSVCIPARNETHAMTQCLESVIASDYEKLEIIVFDDSSVDDTSVLIKSFARSGVRFVEGAKPKSWLGKNFALQGLLNEASGKYAVFMDVDVIIAPNTISDLMRYTVAHQASMVSVIPQRLDRWRSSVWFGSLRYLWLLILDTKERPAASGPLWCVDRDQLQALGGVSAFKNDVQPETAIAAAFAKDDKFKTVLSNNTLGVTYQKKWSSQIEASIRLLAPTTGGGFYSFAWLVGLFTLIIALATLPIGLYLQSPVLILAGTTYNASMSLIFCFYFAIMWGQTWWLGGLVIWPIIIIQEAMLLAASIIQYARGQVSWKGRMITRE